MGYTRTSEGDKTRHRVTLYSTVLQTHGDVEDRLGTFDATGVSLQRQITTTGNELRKTFEQVCTRFFPRNFHEANVDSRYINIHVCT